MVLTKLNGIEITGIAAAVNNDWLSVEACKNEENAETLDKFTKMTGVKGHYCAAQEQTTSDFCYASAKALLEKHGIDPSEIGILVFVTQTADYIIPATACVLQERLGISKDCAAFDVNLGCSGYVYGLSIIGSMMQSSNVKYALLLCGDTSAKEMNPQTAVKSGNSFKFLFGDAGTATLLTKTENAPEISCASRTDGKGFGAIIRPFARWRNPLGTEAPRMDDIAVFNFTISDVPRLIRDFLGEIGKTVEDFDYLVPHQANLYILKQMAKKAKIPFEKLLISIDQFGNTSSSSIPITMVKHFGEENDGDFDALLCGFGVGLSWGISSVKIKKSAVMPLIFTDEYYVDGFRDENYGK